MRQRHHGIGAVQHGLGLAGHLGQDVVAIEARRGHLGLHELHILALGGLVLGHQQRTAHLPAGHQVAGQHQVGDAAGEHGVGAGLGLAGHEIHHLHIGFACGLQALGHQVEVIHDPYQDFGAGQFIWRAGEPSVEGYVAASDPRRLGIEPVIIRSAVEPHQINAENVANLVREFDLEGKKVMATSAALIRDKDPVTLVRAVGELAKTRRDFVFLHFGAGGDREQQAKDEAHKLGIEDVYRFAGFRKGVEDFYSILDVFVMSSEEEALGSSVLDAFLQRVPVVSTDAGGLKESLADGRGVLCAVADFHAMAQGMARCLDDAAFRHEVTERAYEYVRNEHDVQKMGNRYLAQFERLVGRR